MVKISFIIVTYNSELLIEDCLSSIYKFADLPTEQFEVIIVDNSNAEGHRKLKNVLELLPYKPVVIHNSVNSGYGAGNNVGIRRAQGKTVAIMNPDVRIQSEIMRAVDEYFETHKDAGILSFRQIGGKNLTFYSRPEHKIYFLDGLNTKRRNKLLRFSPEKDFISGAFFFADRKKFIEIGMFDEYMFMYNEESDIARRFLASGYTQHLDPSHAYLHLIEARPFNEKSFDSELQTLKFYIRKHQLNESAIWRKYLWETWLKKKMAQILGRNADVERFSKMIALIKNCRSQK